MKAMACFISVLCLLSFLCPGAYSQARTFSFGERGITVIGEGIVKARPDTAKIGLEVKSIAILAADALEKNEKKLKEVLGALKNMGIKEEDIEETSPVFYSGKDGSSICFRSDDELKGFTVSRGIIITLKDVTKMEPEKLRDRIAQIVDGSAKAGAIPGWAKGDLKRSMGRKGALVSFSMEDTEKKKEEALELAISDGRKKAEELANKLGVKLGKLQSAQCIRGAVTSVLPSPFSSLFEDRSSMYPGEMETKVTVSLSYELESSKD